MPLTESVTIPLEGEQAALFADLERDEQAAVNRVVAPFREKRGAYVSAILAGKGLLKDATNTKDLNIKIDGAVLILTPPPASPPPE